MRADARRRGIAGALLRCALTSLHHAGKPWDSAEIDEADTTAAALFASIGAEYSSNAVELVWG
ncbi:hypothetical protein [Nocardia veterana]|uniref:hypothetical protein n=1 Tax=Nocardia veterana TaxID=132249 RepID=UPI000316A62B|nr:hypothetical protein [Nocardia veterana]